jgi:hypothetical protein
VLVVQDVHRVIGRRELDFEGLYRETVEPALEKDTGMRLPFFAWCPHGAGEGYEAVTITTLDDGAALDRYQERIRFGDLGEVWTQSEGMRYSLHSSVHLLQEAVSDWQELISPRTSTGVLLYRLDILELSAAAQSVTADLNQLVTRDDDAGVLSPLCWWSPLFGDGSDRSVAVLSRITSDAALKSAFSPGRVAEPWARSAEELISGVVTRVHRRLLRSPAWVTEQPS